MFFYICVACLPMNIYTSFLVNNFSLKYFSLLFSHDNTDLSTAKNVGIYVKYAFKNIEIKAGIMIKNIAILLICYNI